MFQDTLLVLALITDAFLACFAYGAERIRIPIKSALLMGGIGTGVLLFSMLLSAPFRQILPEKAAVQVGGDFLCSDRLLGRNPGGRRPLQDPVRQGSRRSGAGAVLGFLRHRLRQRLYGAPLLILNAAFPISASGRHPAGLPSGAKSRREAAGGLFPFGRGHACGRRPGPVFLRIPPK